jgi:5'-nucleotidase (lipoprotein e(P4) family)
VTLLVIFIEKARKLNILAMKAVEFSMTKETVRMINVRTMSAAGLFCVTILVVTQVFSTAQAPSTARQGVVDNEYQTGALLWTQSSAEYRALAYQTFALARLRLDENLRSRGAQSRGNTRRSARTPQRAAVIVDADETVLDNSRFQAELVVRELPYDPQTWRAWCQRAEAGAVPGAVDFLNYAARRGVRVFYVTNRRQPEKAGTIGNLQKLGFPDVSEATVMVREEGAPASKESRRQEVAARYRIALLVGDNLNDFTDDFSVKSIAERAAQVDLERNEFGTRFIVVPNPMYGDWENAVYENKPRLTEVEKRAYRRQALKGW